MAVEAQKDEPDRDLLNVEEGDTVVVTAGAWKDTVGVIKSINEGKADRLLSMWRLFGRETPVELSFTEIKEECKINVRFL